MSARKHCNIFYLHSVLRCGSGVPVVSKSAGSLPVVCSRRGLVSVSLGWSFVNSAATKEFGWDV